MKRYEYLKLLRDKITDELVYCSIAGVAKDWCLLKERDGNFYQVYMSGTTPVSLGTALALPHRRVIALDSDGSQLMGMTILPVIARQNPSNLIVIVFDNEVYEAAGKVPTATSGPTDLEKIAIGAGIKNTYTIRELPDFQQAIDEAFEADGATYIVVKVDMGYLQGPWLALDGTENKYRFIRYVEETEDIQIIKPPIKKQSPTDEV